MMGTPRPVAVYARVSTADQNCGSQLHEIREYLAVRGLSGTEYVDHGHSGAKRSRPALDALLQSVRRRKHSVLVCWSLDRLSRSAAHAAALIDELHQLDVTIIALKQGIDTSTPMGRAFGQLAGIFAELERLTIVDRVRAGIERRRAAGKPLGRPRQTIAAEDLERTGMLSTRKAAAILGVSHVAVHRARVLRKPVEMDPKNSSKTEPAEPASGR